MPPLPVGLGQGCAQQVGVGVDLGQLTEHRCLQLLAAQAVLVAGRPTVARAGGAGVVVVAAGAVVGGGADQRAAAAVAHQAQAAEQEGARVGPPLGWGVHAPSPHALATCCLSLKHRLEVRIGECPSLVPTSTSSCSGLERKPADTNDMDLPRSLRMTPSPTVFSQTEHAGRVAIVTGANHGIGAATASPSQRAAHRSWSATCDWKMLRTLERRTPTVTTGPGTPKRCWRPSPRRVVSVSEVEMDLSDPMAPARLFDLAERELGPVSILVNNASAWSPDTFQGGQG